MQSARYLSIAIFIALLSICSFAQEAPQDPFINAVMNVASYGDASISPGEMIVVFGTDLGPAELTHLKVGPNGRLVSDLEGVRVFAGGIPCPLIYVSRYQLAAMIPYGVTAWKQTLIQVEVAGVKSNAYEMVISPSAPGIFTANASGAGQAAINNSDGTMNSSRTPAKRGNWITFYLTGEGEITPAGDDGTIIRSTTAVRQPVRVKIAGYDAEVLYAGSAPGNVNGFAQINAIIPKNLPYGGELPLAVEIGGRTSRPDVTVAVEGPQGPRPSKPIEVTVQNLGNGKVRASWRGNGHQASKYLIERALNGGGFQQIAATDAGETSYDDLPTGDVEELAYRVQAYNEWGISEYSDTVTTSRGKPSVKSPSKLQSSAKSSSEVLLSWLNKDPSANQIVIESKHQNDAEFSELARIPVAQSYILRNLNAATTYSFRVRAIAPSGNSGYSNTCSSTTFAESGPPPAPIPTLEISVSPNLVSLSGGQSQQFSASVTGTTNTAVTWTLYPQVGSISANGLYTAPSAVSSAQTVSVTARSVADPTKTATATVNLVAPAPIPVVSVSVSPTLVSLGGGQSQQFTTSVTGTSNTGVTWSLSPQVGSINSGGLYTAPATVSSAQSVTVTARSVADSTKTASATVSLVPPAPVVQISVSPTSVSLNGGQTRQFTASVTGASDTGVTWSLSPQVGSISAGGLYTAPATVSSAQTVTVTARSVADSTKSASAAVSLVPPAPVVEVSVSPTSVSLNGGQTRQFTASVTGASNTGVTWSLSPQVGSISAGGLYTAPATVSSAQTVTVIARSVADSTKSASAAVSLVPPAPVVQISVSPTSVSLNGGQTTQFTASVTGTSNTGVTWSLSPQVGSISAGGLYAAPSTVSMAATVTVTARSAADTTKTASATVSLVPPAPVVPSGVSFWKSQAIPSYAQHATDRKSVTLGIRFASDVPGKVLGIRFYKGPDNVGTHVGNLWSASGTNLGELIFTNETGSGWQDGFFATPILIAANTTYVASYFAPNGAYAYDQFFNWSGVSALPLRVSGNDPGVYWYGTTTGYPSSNWNVSNYWVDVIFQSDTETEAPPTTTYTISGNVSGITSAVVTLSGLSSASTTTNSSGNYSFTDLENGLYVVVPSKTGYEFSPSSASVTVNSASVSGINFASVALPPPPPTVTLNWNASPSTNVVGYNLYRSTSNGGPYSKINSSPVGSTSYVDSNVIVGQTYFYVATAVDGSGMESTFSNQASAPLN